MLPTQSALEFQLVHQAEEREYISDSEGLEREKVNQQLINRLQSNLRVARMKALTHKSTARFWKQFDIGLNLFNTVLAAISGTTALSSSNPSTTGALGLIVAVLTAINAFLKPINISNEHLKFAAKYGLLRDKIDLFLSENCIIEDENNEKYRLIRQKNSSLNQDIQQLLKKLDSEFNKLEEKAPIALAFTAAAAVKEILGSPDKEKLQSLYKLQHP